MACANFPKYTYFWRSESPFSQWYKCKFTVGGILYNCAEQYMMHQKAVMFGDKEIADQIMKSSSQKQQKSLGRKVSNFSEDIWNKNSREVVYNGNFAKFSQNSDIKQKLLDTEGTILVEASPVDSIWGIGYAEDHPNARDRTKWRGENRLGYILTDVREAILKDERSCDDQVKDTGKPQAVQNTQAASAKKTGAAKSDPQKYTFFWKNESPFSQWYRCKFTADGIAYNCAEQYMMQQKAVLFKDHAIADRIMKTDSPKSQKALGRKVSSFNPQVWDEESHRIVYNGNMAKFSQNEDLKQILLDTQGTVLAEASPYDCIWGIGYKADHPRAKTRHTWKGENRLGFILTEVRDAILKGQEPEDIPNTKADGVKTEKGQKELSAGVTTQQNSTQSQEQGLSKDRYPIESEVEERALLWEDEDQVIFDGQIPSSQQASEKGLLENNGIKEDNSLAQDARNMTEIPSEGNCKRKLLSDTGQACHSQPPTGTTEDNLSENSPKILKKLSPHSQMKNDLLTNEEETWQVVKGKGRRRKSGKRK